MRLHVVCQALLLAVALLHARPSRCEDIRAALVDPADTADAAPGGGGSGSFTLISRGVAAGQPAEPVRPEVPEASARPARPGAQIKSKAQYTRTALHVARSLDPDATETMQVRTRTGDVATLIVKRRSRTRTAAAADAPPPYPAPQAAANASAAAATATDLAKRIAKAARAAPGGSASVRVPDPVDIRSSTVLVKAAAGAEGGKRARSLMKVGADGIPVIEGVRVPDDEDDKKYTWRNARVINGVLVPNNVTIVTSARSANATGVKEAAARPVRPPPSHGVPASLDDAVVKKLAESTAQSPWIPTSPDGANVVAPPLLTPQLHGAQSRAEQQRRILEYIRAVNQLEAGRAASAASAASAANAATGARGRMLRNTEAAAEARVLHYQPALLYSAQSTNPARVVSFEEGVRTPVLQYAHPELGVQPAKVAPPAAASSSARTQDRALAYFGQDIHADRSPYAREPGLDLPEEPVKPISAKRSSSEAGAVGAAPTTGGVSGLPSLPYRPKKVQPLEDSYGLASDKYIKRFPHAASYKDYRDYKDDYGAGYGYRYNSYNPQYAYSAAHSPFEDSRPFWVRLSDSIQTSMRSGMERMSDLARPVVDPLVEASAKISQNLGFAPGGGVGGGGGGVGGVTRGAQGAQDRLGSVGAAVATPSMLLPALGLVAGGAALGLGAVAVGRYLDVDVMAKRSEAGDEDDEDSLEMEHKRALSALQAGQQRYLSEAQPEGTDSLRQVTDTDVVAQVVDVINKQQQQQQHNRQPEGHQAQQAHSRTRRDSGPDTANTLDSAELAEERRQLALRAAQLGAPTAVWGSTPCAQRVFCDVLTREGADSALLMEKKMATLLAMLPRVAPEAAAIHLSAVMSAVRRGDCSEFVCPLPAAVGPRR